MKKVSILLLLIVLCMSCQTNYLGLKDVTVKWSPDCRYYQYAYHYADTTIEFESWVFGVHLDPFLTYNLKCHDTTWLFIQYEYYNDGHIYDVSSGIIFKDWRDK